ncbi:MAG: hypothetical protein CL666_04665 [Balneola sp.]|nr:hypothetical protein [Balneola sp.]|tara:strand:+ start:42434 stop:42823 length:390 start_codon:yes stop_codon:yes gene_type:complete
MIADAYYEQKELAYELKDMMNAISHINKPAYLLDYFDFFCQHMDVSPGDIAGTSRKQEIYMPRCQFVAFVREISNETITLKEIGRLLSDRDHSSIINSLEAHSEWMVISDAYRQGYNGLMKMWRLRNGK